MGIHARVKQHSSRHRLLAAISRDVNTTARLKPGESLFFPSVFFIFFPIQTVVMNCSTEEQWHLSFTSIYIPKKSFGRRRVREIEKRFFSLASSAEALLVLAEQNFEKAF